MTAFKDEARKTWYCKFRYTDFDGVSRVKTKRGFPRKKDAEQWEADFLQRLSKEPTITFPALCDEYLEDTRINTKKITYETKKSRINLWIRDAFGTRPINEIRPEDIRKFENSLKTKTGSNGKPLSEGYLNNLVRELSGVFNYAVRYKGLSINPCHAVGRHAGKKQKSILFWTKEEFDKFIETFKKEDPYYTVFMVFYYTGLRKGELQALTPADIDLEAGLISVNKTLHVIDGEVVITPPKTAKSNRTVTIPGFLCDIIREYENRLYGIKKTDRIFPSGKTTFASQLEHHAEIAGVKRIRIHDLRHSHASYLIELGFPPILIAERLGHDNANVTMSIYAHLYPSKQSEVADRLEKIFRDHAMTTKNDEKSETGEKEDSKTA
jgi:integrase